MKWSLQCVWMALYLLYGHCYELENMESLKVISKN